MESQKPAPPSQATVKSSHSCSLMAIINLVLRALAVLLLFISLIVLTTAAASSSSSDYGDFVDYDYNNFYAYRYTLYTIIIGMVYALMQTGLAIFCLTTGTLLSFVTSILIQFNFYADKFISYTLATGAAAAFGLTVDAKRYYGESSFWDKTSASGSLLFLAFICSAVSSIFSSLALSNESSSIVVQHDISHSVQSGNQSTIASSLQMAESNASKINSKHSTE